MCDPGVRAFRDFDSAQIAVIAKPLRRRADDGPLSSRARCDEGAVDVPKKKAVFSVCHSERSFANAKRSRGISLFVQREIQQEIPRLRSE